MNNIKKRRAESEAYNILKLKIENQTATDIDLAPVLADLEEYFTSAAFPTLNSYTGKYAGPLLDACFEHHPDIFDKNRYEMISQSHLNKLIGKAAAVLECDLRDRKFNRAQLDFLSLLSKKYSPSSDEQLNDVDCIIKLIDSRKDSA